MEADVLVFVPTISSKCPISSKPGPCGTLSATGYHRAMQGALKPSALMTRKLSEVQGMLLGSGLAWRRGPKHQSVASRWFTFVCWVDSIFYRLFLI